MLQQHKTGIYLEIPLHEIALGILGERKTGPIFYLPAQRRVQTKFWINGVMMLD
jgi:hypothetical protein